jgi:hypothetical protein
MHATFHSILGGSLVFTSITRDSIVFTSIRRDSRASGVSGAHSARRVK